MRLPSEPAVHAESLHSLRWLPRYLDTCVWLDNNQPAGWDGVISLSLSLSLSLAQCREAGAARADQMESMLLASHCPPAPSPSGRGLNCGGQPRHAHVLC